MKLPLTMQDALDKEAVVKKLDWLKDKVYAVCFWGTLVAASILALASLLVPVALVVLLFLVVAHFLGW